MLVVIVVAHVIFAFHLAVPGDRLVNAGLVAVYRGADQQGCAG